MPKNPIYSSGRIDAQNNGLTHENPATNPQKKYLQKLNKFNNSYKFANTERFADVSPFMYLDCVSRDIIPFRSTHQLSSYTLKSPMMDEIYKHKFYSLVPYRAILPNTWEIFYVNPTKGDDVPDDVYCNVNILNAWNNYFKFVRDIPDNTAKALHIVQFFIATESIFSTGSLLNSLKYNFWPYLYLSSDDNFDNLFDRFAGNIGFISLDREVQPGLFETIKGSDVTGMSYARLVSNRTILDILRSGDYNRTSLNVPSSLHQSLFDLFDDFITLKEESFDNFFVSGSSMAGYDVDLSAVIAYQITCVSQVTDASIDYIFNANLFRNILFPLPDNIEVFNYNGRTFLYETFSKKYLESLWFSTVEFYDTCCKLFSFAKSLKFGDYFTQMRPEPYGVGDLTLSTTELDAVNITRRIVYQRFLNWNNRVGPKYEDYHKEMTGMDPVPDPTEPSLINHTKSIVGSYEVENTSEAQLVDQNSVTTLLRDKDASFAFDIVVSEPSILLGLSSYDMQRLYTRIMDRSHLKEDRFDFFNHMLQYTGDQDIKSTELDSRQSPNAPIGYNTKDIHYKMQVSHASGGFINNLKSWAFTTEDTDNDMSLSFGISPDFIRNYNSDFDRFYSSLSGYSLGNYFHFILKYTNDFSDMQRAMAVAPDIL